MSSADSELTSPDTAGSHESHEARHVTMKEGTKGAEEEKSRDNGNENGNENSTPKTYVDIETGAACQKTCVVMPVHEDIQQAGAAAWWQKRNPLMLMGNSFRLNNNKNSNSVRVTNSRPSRRNLFAEDGNNPATASTSFRGGGRSFRGGLAQQPSEKEDSSIRQYRIVSSRRAPPINSAFGRYYYAAHKHAVSLIHRYIQWTFRTSFSMVTLASFALFMALIIVFALCIMWADYYQPEW